MYGMNLRYASLIVLIIMVGLLSVHLGFCSKKGPMKRSDLAYQTRTAQDIIDLWDWRPDEITGWTKKYIDSAQESIDQILQIPDDQRSFLNTVQTFDTIGALSDFTVAANIFETLELSSPDEAIRNAAHKAVLAMKAFWIEAVSTNKALYQALKVYAEGNAAEEKLSQTEHYFLSETIKDLERAGLNLPDDQLVLVKKVKKELIALTQNFERNIAQDKSHITVDIDDLKGLDENFIKNLKRADDGAYILGVDYPTIFNVIENCAVEDTRKRLSNAFANRAYPANEVILKEVIAKRDELAKLLGFASYADLDLDNQMVKNPGRAYDFIRDLVNRIEKKVGQELDQWVAELPASVVLTADGKIKPWDFQYLKTTYKKKHFAIDEREIAKYFPMEKTIEGLLDVYRQFLSIDFEEVPVSGLWHDDVKMVKVYTKDRAQLLGYLLLDLYPRPNKFSHAAHFSVIPAGFQDNNQRRVAMSVVLANFPKPTSDRPSLLMRSDVNTFFHEFGHALHALLGATEQASVAGTSVKKDFVELPSQMLEEWLWDKEILQKVSSHYQTGKSLSDELIEKILQLKHFDSGNWLQRQASLAMLSLDYFAQGAHKDPFAILQKLQEQYQSRIMFNPDNHMYAAFGHLAGYGAKYYGYLWSKVFALDLFAEIKKHGLLNPQIGAKYIREVIGKGGSQDPNELLRNFLGREPNNDAFLKDIGLAKIQVLPQKRVEVAQT